ncbi:MAG: hypothetical protein RL721_2318 [Candidatus Eisenbacteria bacterium]
MRPAATLTVPEVEKLVPAPDSDTVRLPPVTSIVPTFECTAEARPSESGYETVSVPWLSSAAERLRFAPVPGRLRMTPPGAFVSVPAVRLSVAKSGAPTAPAFVVRSRVPLLVKLLATVSVPEVLETIWMEITPPVRFANAPATLLAPVTVSVPALVRALATDEDPRPNEPWLEIAPVPFTVHDESEATPCAPTVVGPLSVIVREVADSVCTPEVEPFTRNPASVTLTFIVTV